MKRLMATAAFCLASGIAHAQNIHIHADVELYNGDDHQLVSQKSYSTIAECESSLTHQNLISANTQTPYGAWELRNIQGTFTRGVSGRTIRPPYVPDNVEIKNLSQLTDIEKVTSVQCANPEPTKTMNELWTGMLATFKR